MTTINMKQLRAILSYLSVPSAYYNLGEYGLRDMHYCLKQTERGWETFYSERGQHFREKIFDNETDACLDMLTRLVHTSW